MKRIICLMLALVCCLAMAACGGPEPIVPELNTAYTVEEVAELSLISISSSPKVEATMANGIYYENTNSEHTFVDAVFTYTNLTEDIRMSDELMTVTGVNPDRERFNGAIYCVESADMADVNEYENVYPMETVRLHAALSVPKTETDLSLTFTVGEQKFTIDYTVGDDFKQTIPLAEGDELTAADYAALVYHNYTFTDTILPTDVSGPYSYYEVDNTDNTYLALSFQLTNEMSDGHDMDKFLYCTATFDGKFSYTGFLVAEEEDGTGFDSYVTLDPLAPRHVLCLIEVPDTVVEMPVSISVIFDKQEYTISK